MADVIQERNNTIPISIDSRHHWSFPAVTLLYILIVHKKEMFSHKQVVI